MFDFGSSDSSKLEIDATAGKDVIKAGGDDLTGAIDFNITPPDNPLPLHVVFCIDNSGSMSGQDIRTARNGLNEAAQELTSNDTFGVVSFNSSASRVVSAADGGNAHNYSSEITSIDAGGGTSIMAGLDEAKAVLQTMQGTHAAKWIVLISDGGSAINSTRLEAEFSEAGITIHSAGIGGYDQSTMHTVAETTQGEWEDVGSPQKLGTFFKEKISEARGVVALDPTLRIESEPFVKINDAYYTHGEQQSLGDPEWDATGCTIELGDLTASKPPKVRLDMFADGDAQIEEQKLATATLSTDSQTIEDTIAVEIASPVVAEEKETIDENRGGLAVADIMETALEEGTNQAKRKLANWEDDDSVDEAALDEAEKAIEDMERASDDKEAKDTASRVLGTWDEDQ